jgi:NitT/TauT family transport system substrate-binding protein
MAFLAANPACALKLHWAAYPASKGAGDEAVVMKNDLHSINRAIRSMDHAYQTFGGGKQRGVFDNAAWEHLIKFMVKTKQIDNPVPLQNVNVRIPDLVAKINNFDINAVRESAKACKV